jgi:Protein of unknown function (DUF2867)
MKILLTGATGYVGGRLLTFSRRWATKSAAWPAGRRIWPLTQTAMFDLVGVLGRAYWYGIYPLHSLVFNGLVKAIAERARRPVRPVARTAPT